jgi:hypothetical protein
MNRTTCLFRRQPLSVLCARLNKLALGQLCTFLKFSSASFTIPMATVDLSNYNSEQARLMKERCILVNENDNALGAIDKKDCTFS